MNIKKSIVFAKKINKALRIKPKNDKNGRFQVRKHNTLLRIYNYIQKNYFIEYGECNIHYADHHDNTGHYYYDLYNTTNDIFITYYT